MKEDSKPALSGRRPKATTLADVAAMAGVVPMTASRAINKSGYVSDEVRERVLEAARTLQYRPNIIARQLRGSRLNVIGVVLPDIANPFSAELMSGINEVLNTAGFTCFLGTTENSAEQERTVLQSFVDHRIDGLLVATQYSPIGQEAMASIASQGVPTVVLGRSTDLQAVDCVSADDYQGAFDAATHLASVGHTRIGFIGCSVQDEYRLPRFVGFEKGLNAAGLSLFPEHAIGRESGPGWATEQDGYQGMTRLASMKRRPTAVLARNDAAAIGALRAAQVLKLRVPRDIAIAGFDNIPAAAYQSPPLTTVEQPARELGRTAARLLIGRIQGTRSGARKAITMKCSLIVRESTAPAHASKVAQQ